MVEKEEGEGGPGGISEEEAAQYDRQIRLWGLEAQKRLRASRVLLVGLRGLGAEVAKNLILAGVRALTMLDHHQVSPEDTRAQFLVPAGSVGRNRAEASLERAQNLNPMVDVKADPENVESKPEAFFTQFDAVCVTCCSRDAMLRIDHICHQNGIKFFAGDVFGYHGYAFADLGEHDFVEEKTKVAKANSPAVEDGPGAKRAKLDAAETTMVKKRIHFCPLKDALNPDWSSEQAQAALKRTSPDFFLLQVLLQFRTDAGRDPQPQHYTEDCARLLSIRGGQPGAGALPDTFVGYCFSEMAAVCAVVGGVLGQEVVKPPGPEAEVVHPRGALWESDGRVRRNATMAAALDVGSKEQKDAALDRRIAALRKKNEALVRRYQEIEEDRRRAELRGGAVTAPRRTRDPQRRYGATEQPPRSAPRKPPTATPRPPRTSTRPPRTEAPPTQNMGGGDGVHMAVGGGRGGRGRRARGRGGSGAAGAGGDGVDRRNQEWEERRRQNIERMNEEMEKIAEYERNQRDGVHERNPVRNFLDDPRRCGPAQEEGSRRHGRNWGGPDFEGVRAGMEREKGRSPKAADVTLSMTGRERAEYERWKRERERIDRERLARHRQPTGQWRREWDAHKSDSMFKDGAPPSDPAPHNPPSLPPPRTERRRKGRGRSPPPSKPYSMHDDRWEEEEGVEEEQQQQQETRTPPPDDEDEWEDVSDDDGDAAPPPPPPASPPHKSSAAPPPPPLRDWGEEMENGAPPTAPPESTEAAPPTPPPGAAVDLSDFLRT